MRALFITMAAAITVSAAEVDFVRPIWGPPAGFPATLRDVASRLPPDTAAKEPDLVTYTHEATHFLSSGRKDGYHGLYVGDGLRLYVPTPPLLTARVFAAIPEDKRGTIYDTYRRQGESEGWRAQPLMILDEWNAYLMGARARRELRLDSRRETNVHCATMAGYAAVMYRLVKDCDGYPHAKLKGFCDWQLARCREVIPDWDELSDAKFD